MFRQTHCPLHQRVFSAGAPNMCDDNSDTLDARVWVKDADTPVLIGERFRRQDGVLTMTWHIDPNSISGVMWVEDIHRKMGKVSPS